jgi:hypothetical protein
VRKSDADQGVGRTLWTASILSPFFSPETFSLTRGALRAEEKRPFFLYAQIFSSKRKPQNGPQIPVARRDYPRLLRSAV